MTHKVIIISCITKRESVERKEKGLQDEVPGKNIKLAKQIEKECGH